MVIYRVHVEHPERGKRSVARSTLARARNTAHRLIVDGGCTTATIASYSHEGLNALRGVPLEDVINGDWGGWQEKPLERYVRRAIGPQPHAVRKRIPPKRAAGAKT